MNLSYRKELNSHLLDQVDILKQAHFSFDGWRDLLCDQTDPSTLTSYQIYILCLKCLYLSKLYEFSFHFYNSISNFKDIAKLVVDHVNKDYKHVEGISTLIGDPQTVLSWFRIFRKANNTFSYTRPGKSSDLPPFLDQNPDVVESINSYCKNNLADLNCANLCQHLHDVIIPNLVNLLKIERNDEDYDKEKLLKEYSLRKLFLLVYGISSSKSSQCMRAGNIPAEDFIRCIITYCSFLRQACATSHLS